MNRFTTRTGPALVAAAAMTALAACGGGDGGGGGSSQSASDTLTIALDADAAPTGYDPLLYSQGQFTFFSALYDALFVTAADGTVEPSLVTEFANNAENTQTTLTLRDDVTFADGSTLDSDAGQGQPRPPQRRDPRGVRRARRRAARARSPTSRRRTRRPSSSPGPRRRRRRRTTSSTPPASSSAPTASPTPTRSRPPRTARAPTR